MAQVHRDDGIGIVARQWVISPGNTEKDFRAWLESRRTGLILKASIEISEQEYAGAVADLRNGRKTPTFPDWFNREGRERLDEQSHAFHKENPEITPSEYLHILHLRLRKEIETQHVIYIDICHWVKMRHWILDHPNKTPVYRSILETLRQLRAKQRIICPISFPLFVELMRQSDTRTREATARLMDELSDGICLQKPRDLIRTEIQQQITRSMFGDRALDLMEWVWTKAGWIAGERLPVSEAFSLKDNEYLQKTFVDLMWETKLEDVIDGIDQKRFPHMDGEALASAYNTDATFYHEKKMSFAEVLAYEKAHLFRLMVKQPFDEIAMEYHSRYPDQVAKLLTEKESHQKPSPLVLPFMQIVAGINAIFIMSREAFSPNDLADAEHAALALPYCDTFFCDSPLSHKLNAKPLRLNQAYGTNVVGAPTAFLKVISDL